ncbi:transposase [Olsenella sp. oral taxon 807]|uniref:transposase n=1 Tax=Olsenella sp. oral taxon 807 TaxID=712411 RepID=UPI00067A1AD4|nr:transposase [Olsenella sp. oral taxon 807]
MPAGFLVTPGTSADRGSAVELIRGFDADALLAEARLRHRRGPGRGERARHGGARPPKSDRREKRAIGPHPYEQRHLVENAFERVRRWRGLATRYRERLSSLVVAVQIRCTSLWLRIL